MFLEILGFGEHEIVELKAESFHALGLELLYVVTFHLIDRVLGPSIVEGPFFFVLGTSLYRHAFAIFILDSRLATSGALQILGSLLLYRRVLFLFQCFFGKRVHNRFGLFEVLLGFFLDRGILLLDWGRGPSATTGQRFRFDSVKNRLKGLLHCRLKIFGGCHELIEPSYWHNFTTKGLRLISKIFGLVAKASYKGLDH
jgi:hypothetical protein